MTRLSYCQRSQAIDPNMVLQNAGMQMFVNIIHQFAQNELERNPALLSSERCIRNYLF